MGGPKRSLWETVEVKSGLLWRTQVTEDAKAVEVLPKRPLHIALETAQERDVCWSQQSQGNRAT